MILGGGGFCLLYCCYAEEHIFLKKLACSCTGMNHNSADYLHLLVEAFKLSLADTTHFNADPAHVNVPLEGLLAKDYSQQRAQLIQMDRCGQHQLSGSPGMK